MTDVFTDTAGVVRLEGSLTLATGAPAVLVASKTLTSAQLLALSTVAVELLPAPGGRYYYDVQHIVWHYRPGATPYAGSFEDLVIGFYPAGVPFPDYNPSGPVSGFVAPNSQLSGYQVFGQTEDLYIFSPAPLAGFNGMGWLASAIENKPLSAGLQNVLEAPDPVVPWTNGNGTLTLRVFYSLINGAP